jgi:DNA-binding SARP family transcriptional activator
VTGPVAEAEFCLLGPLQVRVGGTDVPVRAARQRAVLAALLLSANQVVPVAELAALLWGASPPPSARVAVQNYVLRLRKALGEAGRARISTQLGQPGGYLIRVEPGELDVHRFEALLAGARAAAGTGAWETAAERARAALALWRGEPLADVESAGLAGREGARLAGLRLQALEARIEADVRLGGHAEVITELQRLIGEHPRRERFHAQLMLALYQYGRRAEALAAYRRARGVLIAELGTEPGAELRELHQRMLAADPGLGAPAVAPGPARPVPRQLPAVATAFTGRAAELTELTSLLDRAGGGQAVPIGVIGGPAGAGKTTLAVRWAHQVAGRFPDGQLYVNLGGADWPVPAGVALAAFLTALGLPGDQIPAEPGERAARFRSLLAGRRVLVVADNAWSAEQVRPLLPGSGACMAVVTSRDPLAGLVARDGAWRLDLAPQPDLAPRPDLAAQSDLAARPGVSSENAATCVPASGPLAGQGKMSS